MRKLVLAAALLASTAITANAATVANLGVNPTSATGTFQHTVGGGAFTDQITFQLVGASPQWLTIASATNVFPNTTDFITNFTAQGFLQVGAIGGGDDIAVTPLIAAVPCPTQADCQGFAGSALLAAGNYYLQLAGIGGGTSGYGGNLSVVPVPIPGALALFATGLVGLGLLKRKRKNVA